LTVSSDGNIFTGSARVSANKKFSSRRTHMQLTPREFDKLLIYMLADVALKRRAKGLKLNYPEAVAIISAAALDGQRENRRWDS
jgi:hypothetical protein